MLWLISSTCCPSPSIASQPFLLHSLGMSSPAQKFETGKFFDPHSNVIIFELATKVQNLEDSIFSTSEKQEDLAMPGLVSLNDICGWPQFLGLPETPRHWPWRSATTYCDRWTILSHSRADLLLSLSSYMILWPIVCACSVVSTTELCLQLYGL